MRQVLMAALLLLVPAAQAQQEPIVRIGLTQNAATVTVRSAAAFRVEQHTTRTATFAAVLALDAGSPHATLKTADLQRRLTVQLDGDVLLVLPLSTHLRLEPSGAPFEIESRAYRGVLEVFGNARQTITVVNELPLEDYLRGVVPNELNPK